MKTTVIPLNTSTDPVRALSINPPHGKADNDSEKYHALLCGPDSFLSITIFQNMNPGNAKDWT